MTHQTQQKNKGFALLYTVLVVTLILTIAISISNVSYKQGVLSSLAKDSQIAFYQADSGTECALYYDQAINAFPYPTVAATAPSTISCGNQTLTLDSGASSDNYFVYEFDNTATSNPCYSLVFDKASEFSSSGLSIIQSRGLSRCEPNPRQVERALEIRY